MAKKNQQTKDRSCVKCECSTCGQVSNARPDSPHQFCKGIKLSIIAQLPAGFKDITNPNRKGTWRPYVAPVVQSANPEPTPEVSAQS
jgi:hypothetical protein